MGSFLESSYAELWTLMTVYHFNGLEIDIMNLLNELACWCLADITSTRI